MSREAQSRAAKPRETKRRQPLPERAFHRAGSAVAFTAANAAAETGAEERPLTAVSARNFLTQPYKKGPPENAPAGKLKYPGNSR